MFNDFYLRGVKIVKSSHLSYFMYVGNRFMSLNTIFKGDLGIHIKMYWKLVKFWL